MPQEVRYMVPDSLLLPPTPPPRSPPSSRFGRNNRNSGYEQLRPPKRPCNKCRLCIILLSAILLILFISLVRSVYLKSKAEARECAKYYTYSEVTGYCYKVEVGEASFEDAKASCESENAHLVSIHSLEENEFVSTAYKTELAKNHPGKNEQRIWIGLVYLNKNWVWTDGSRVDFTKWAISEPSYRYANEFWVQMLVHKQNDYSINGDEWNDIDNGRRLPYVCKKPVKISENSVEFSTIQPPTLPPTTSVTTQSPTTSKIQIPGESISECYTGYTYFNETGFCYKVTLSETPFDVAKRSCEADAAHLASIHSLVENDYLIKFYNQRIAEHREYVDSNQKKSRIWLGLVKINEKWVWTDGTEVDFENWAKGEPNSFWPNENWSLLMWDKTEHWNPNGNGWNNINSDGGYSYFCKKTSKLAKRAGMFTTIQAPTMPTTTTTTTNAPTTGNGR